ncbi:MAG: ECF-type sigma factor [Longimicrobiales bacterium]
MAGSAFRAETTMLLEDWEQTGADAWERLVPIVYDELRRIAHGQIAHEHGAPTLQTTALVHEAFLRLVNDTSVTRRGRAYFFAAAARAMRQVLVDGARWRNAVKRGGGDMKRTDLSAVDVAAESGPDRLADELLELDEALVELAALEPRQARTIECRFFAGMSVQETAQALGLSVRTVKYDWALARAWLYNRLGGQGPVLDE